MYPLFRSPSWKNCMSLLPQFMKVLIESVSTPPHNIMDSYVTLMGKSVRSVASIRRLNAVLTIHPFSLRTPVPIVILLLVAARIMRHAFHAV
mmetsp:Transcript_21121/g.30537  ORF Transcript_21121/g.30537 Transcript_21121/m.30537 type:complete len:92 (-) Transcript_21121:135-410(-)|eukprot:CAMPEP_0185043522 /NCGR_PEP_ID=MMETSP1103-20130426/42948_1 /TAXON_ID=36769 /ORGANISM="Paraphysomonas bandaiensis, Strain Caron Lab Isolate" /LENGTH=91 /DNA_ID=CAMNT_0027583699 /DNA_START=379 /DNA_END=654 /DNA_ORIENTATION=-